MTLRNVNGQNIAQKKRESGTYTPSPETLGAQAAAAILWPIFRKAASTIRNSFTSRLAKQPAASAWYKEQYNNVLGATPVITPVLDLDELTFGKGTMSLTTLNDIDADVSDETVTIGWDVFSDDTVLATDRVSIILINKDAADPIASMLQFSNVAARSATAYVAAVPTGWMSAGDVINAYLQFYGAPSTATAGTSSSTILLSEAAVA